MSMSASMSASASASVPSTIKNASNASAASNASNASAASNASTDQLLTVWNAYCISNSIMHNESRGHFKALNHGLMIPAIILSSATGIGTIGIGTSSNTPCGMDWTLVALGLIGIASTCLMSIHRLMNAAELQREHDLYSDMFASLANEIDMQFILDDSDGISKMFVNKREFIKYCKSRLDVLMDKAPPIPKSIANKHKHSHDLEHEPKQEQEHVKVFIS